jgi:hypothetical protein
VNDPTKKSRAANKITNKRMNCNLMTHFTPAIFIVPSRSTAPIAKPLAAQALSHPTRLAIDSPKPTTFRAHPTACNFKIIKC